MPIHHLWAYEPMSLWAYVDDLSFLRERVGWVMLCSCCCVCVSVGAQNGRVDRLIESLWKWIRLLVCLCIIWSLYKYVIDSINYISNWSHSTKTVIHRQQVEIILDRTLWGVYHGPVLYVWEQERQRTYRISVFSWKTGRHTKYYMCAPPYCTLCPLANSTNSHHGCTSVQTHTHMHVCATHVHRRGYCVPSFCALVISHILENDSQYIDSAWFFATFRTL